MNSVVVMKRWGVAVRGFSGFGGFLEGFGVSNRWWVFGFCLYGHLRWSLEALTHVFGFYRFVGVCSKFSVCFGFRGLFLLVLVVAFGGVCFYECLWYMVFEFYFGCFTYIWRSLLCSLYFVGLCSSYVKIWFLINVVVKRKGNELWLVCSNEYCHLFHVNTNTKPKPMFHFLIS